MNPASWLPLASSRNLAVLVTFIAHNEIVIAAELDPARELQPLGGLSQEAVGRRVAGDDPRGHRRRRAQRHRPRPALGRLSLLIFVRVRK